ncbi:MAG TPA: CHAT domain-containing protein [Thermoanaerobaculia bacterium]|jgi:CHAT domain-containing protein/tetratricopeptide (TPR) repeat protein
MLPRPLSFRGRTFLGLAVPALSLFLATALPAEAPRSEQTLTLGQETQEQKIKAGEAHPWRVEVAPGSSVLVTIDQRSIGLVAEVRRTGGVFGAGNDRWGPVVLLLDTAGDYKIEVRPRDRGPWSGRYTMHAEAVPSKGLRHDALALMSRAGREIVPDNPESRKRAVATYRKALTEWRGLGESFWEAEARTCIAMQESRSSDFKRAAPDLLAALELWKKLQRAPREAETWNWLAVAYLETQTPERTSDAWKNSRALWRQLNESVEEEQIHANLCALERRFGSLTDALDCYQKSLEAFRGIDAPDEEAEILNYIGGIYQAQGDPDAALDSYQRALDLWHALGERGKEAAILNNIGWFHHTLGEWQEALRFYEQSWQTLSTVDDPSLAGSVLNNIGNVYIFLGDPRRAREYVEDALKLQRATGNRLREIDALNSLGIAWRNQGENEKALASHQQAFQVALSLKNAQHQAFSRLWMAEAHLGRGDSSAALGEIDRAFQILGENGNRRTRTRALRLRGEALTLAGRAPEALPVLQEALSQAREIRDPAGEAEALDAIVLAERSLGRTDDALAHAEAAVDIVEGLRSALLGLGAEDLRASFLAARRRSFSLLIDLLMARHAADPAKGYDREAFKVSERAHARSLLDVLSAGAVAASTAPPEMLARRRTLLHQLSAKVNQRWRASGATADALGKEIDQIRFKIDEVEAEIGRSDDRFARLGAPQPVSPETISRELDPGTMLLECSLGEDRSFLWAVEAGRVRSFILPPQAKIEALARQVYRDMSRGEAGSTQQEKAAKELSRILLGPVWTDRAARKAAPLQRLVVVPDGALDLLPFAALPVPNSGRSSKSPSPSPSPLLERVEVVSIPSATTLAVQRQLKRRAPAPQWAAVFGDPIYTADDPRVTRRTAAERSQPEKTRGKTPPVGTARRGVSGRAFSLSLPRLPATGREAEAIKALAPAGKVKLDLGPDATREAVLAGNLRDFRVLHFATHAVADTENPELSGLVLSQVDAAGRPREGFLGLSDIYGLDLQADLVVLSGCRTALGKEVRGEGLIGLTRAFQYAGVPRVVASLWPVEDRATAELMKRFYRAMWRDHDRLSPAAALREAQRSLRRDDPRYADPHSWAGFVFQGDWR